jgi:hypothetical protein
MSTKQAPDASLITGREPQAGAARDSELFARRTARMLWVLLPLTFAITLVFGLIAPSGGEGERYGANTFSMSAVGYHGLTELLQEVGIPVLASQHNSAQRASKDTPLVLLEPLPTGGTSGVEMLIAAVRQRPAPVIVVLPKWGYQLDFRKSRWVQWVGLYQPSVPSEILGVCRDTSSEPADIVRPQASGGKWFHLLDLADGVSPSLTSPQLLSPDVTGIKRLLWSEDGVLVGQIKRNGVLVISDPDLLNNAGLATGDNAILAYHLLVESFHARALVFDETLHGFSRTPSMWRNLLDAPLLVVTLHLALVLAAVAWTASGRFGRPLPPASRVVAGVETLVENTARLISLGGMVSQTLSEYWKATIRRTAQELAVKPAPGPESLVERQEQMLVKLAGRRGVTHDLEQLAAEMEKIRIGRRREPRQALALARRLYYWRKEMVDGTGSDR